MEVRLVTFEPINAMRICFASNRPSVTRYFWTKKRFCATADEIYVNQVIVYKNPTLVLIAGIWITYAIRAQLYACDEEPLDIIERTYLNTFFD